MTEDYRKDGTRGDELARMGIASVGRGVRGTVWLTKPRYVSRPSAPDVGRLISAESDYRNHVRKAIVPTVQPRTIPHSDIYIGTCRYGIASDNNISCRGNLV